MAYKIPDHRAITDSDIVAAEGGVGEVGIVSSEQDVG